MGMSHIDGELFEDSNGWTWRTKDGQHIPIVLMADSHLRNAALFLMGMGYSKCIAANDIRISWLTVFRTEWERRMLLRAEQRMTKLEAANQRLDKAFTAYDQLCLKEGKDV